MDKNDQEILDAVGRMKSLPTDAGATLSEKMIERDKLMRLFNRFEELANQTSLRDEVAMRAMVEILRAELSVKDNCDAGEAATSAYIMADAFLEARKR